MTIKKAVIPAAGYGTRNLPITKVIPKEMFPIHGKPAIHYVVEEALTAGIKEILIIVSRNKNMIMDYFDRSLELEYFLKKTNKHDLLKDLFLPPIHIQYIRQPFATGLGGALSLAEPFIADQPFAVLLPDDVFVKKEHGLPLLMKTYQTRQANVIGVETVAEQWLHQYGVIKERKVEENLYELLDIVEKPSSSPPSNLAVIGRYIFHPEIFSFLKKVKPDSKGEYQLTDAIKSMLQKTISYGQGGLGERFDIGTDEGYFRLLEKLRTKKDS
ncbi:UTP--glucose-1-phosphate uridylyltransferase [Halalkalibacter oceani]|uniref:UTP--glucose-1-phosphate uridylyltransferase n=1 Tax=Halalkalibacter oceani TaxID=1653776 RepID=UPI003393657F